MNIIDAFPASNFQTINPSSITIQTNVKVTTPVLTEQHKFVSAGTNGNLVYLILDESGSMSGLEKDTIGGVNSLIASQAKDNDKTSISILKFEGSNLNKVIDRVDVREMDKFSNYTPRGSTNLLDAVGFALKDINQFLKSKKKKERPSVFIQIFTDGEENSSRQYNKSTIQEMVKSITKKDWVVSYVGANIDSFASASSIGISSASTSNYNSSNLTQTYAAVSSSLSRMKSMRSAGASAESLYSSGEVYLNSEREAMIKGEVK